MLLKGRCSRSLYPINKNFYNKKYDMVRSAAMLTLDGEIYILGYIILKKI